jgi:NTP pyrophosphatase (non-canonical NTP hydrolase)
MSNPFTPLQTQVQAFCEARDWDQFHNVKDLVIGLSTESNELLQMFRFRSEAECDQIMIDKRQAVEEEMADVLYYLLRMAQLYQIDLLDAFQAKMQQNEQKYPQEKVKGKNLKYNEY